MPVVFFVAEIGRLGRAARDRTSKAYRAGTQNNRWTHALLYIAFCIFFGVADFPAEPGVLLLFAEFLLKTYQTGKAATNALSSLRTFHLLFNFSPLAFDDFKLSLWRRSLPFTVRSAPCPAPAFSFSHLQAFCSAARCLGARGRALAALVSTSFYSLARLSSLVPQRRMHLDCSRVPLLQDLRFGGRRGEALLQLKWGKCAQDVSQAFWVPLLPVPSSPACPVALLREVAADLGGLGPRVPLFSFRVEGGPTRFRSLDLSSARSLLADVLSLAGLGHRGYTFHSLRRGGCSLAFSHGAQLSDLQLLGGWKSRAIDSYYPHLDARRRAAQALVRASR